MTSDTSAGRQLLGFADKGTQGGRVAETGVGLKWETETMRSDLGGTMEGWNKRSLVRSPWDCVSQG